MLTAIESEAETSKAVAAWAQRLRAGAEVRTWHGESLYWRQQDGIWAYLSPDKNARGERILWNPHGLTENGDAYRQTMVVEINPPVSGINTRLNGLLARDEMGQRWLCHRGQLRTRPKRFVNETEFDRYFRGEDRVLVTFSDKRPPLRYYRVGCIDDADSFATDLAWFVRECGRIRRVIETGERAPANGHAGVAEPRAGIQPGTYQQEFTGELTLDGRGPTKFLRWHGDVVDALAVKLKALGFEVGAERFSRLAPDIYVVDTAGTVPYLFEVKTGVSSQEIFTAIGQLHYYNRLMKQSAKKIIVVPDELNTVQRGILEGIGIDVVIFKKTEAPAKFVLSGLKAAMGLPE